ncbi:MAG: hypothetical protein MUO54_13555, partial [Anaerolineales bacterium]|nr:hypothetical protein [Anaerolineales bacterium]
IMLPCFFVSDLHGQKDRYLTLFSKIREEKPAGVFLGGDLFQASGGQEKGGFLSDFFVPEFIQLRKDLGDEYPRIFLILGNDDSKTYQDALVRYMNEDHLWDYIHNRVASFGPYSVFGYAYVPPTPFLNKDWERYDVSRYVDPGCIPLEEGWYSEPEPLNMIQHATIQQDLAVLTKEEDLKKSIFLFHTPPYQTRLDRAALDGKMIDFVPLDVHVGSIAVKNFILNRQPLITLHGHVHESPRLGGSWQDKIGDTYALSAAHDGPELALVRFFTDQPEKTTREIC